MFYKHYNGGEYFLLCVTKVTTQEVVNRLEKHINATHTETGDVISVYMNNGLMVTTAGEELALYIDALGVYWLRPVEMFFGKVEVDGEKVLRFTPINPIK